MNTIVIGITSGIAAFKIVDLVENLHKRGFGIIVIMTKLATLMVKPEELEKVSGNKVYTSLFPKDFDYKKILRIREVNHIKVADSADLFVVAPATANVVAKIAHGIADDFLTTSILATKAPILICPSMNVHMWENPVVQDNLTLLEKRGMYILHPDSGVLACGYTGIGRLANIKKIETEIVHILMAKNQLKRIKIIVTAGGTSEPIDTVRFITNKSSGKMGIAIAQECFLRGADVLLLRSVTAVDAIERQDTSGVTRRGSPDGGGIKIKFFETGKDLENLVRRNARSYDVIFHTAAVSDYKPSEAFDRKLDSTKSLILHLETTTKILSQIKKWNPRIKLIGFKAVYKKTDKECIEAGITKLRESQSEYIIVNDVGRKDVGFGVDTNEVFIISPNGLKKKIEKIDKREVAKKIIEELFPINTTDLNTNSSIQQNHAAA